MPTLAERGDQLLGDTVDDPASPGQFHVILLNDELHSYGYIIEMLGKLFLYSHAKALHHAVEIDTTGRSIIITCEWPEAEYAQQQIHGFGPDRAVRGCAVSMQAILEPAKD